MAKKTPMVNDKIFVLWDYDLDRKIMELNIAAPKDWQYWVDWLNMDNSKCFRYVRSDGVTCSVVKELRTHFNNKDDLRPVWYAHKRIDGKLKKKYLGKSEKLTYSALRDAALGLVQMSLL